MNRRSVAKLGLVAFAVGTVAFSPGLARKAEEASAGGYKLTKSVQSSIAQAQEALQRGDALTALSQIQNAEARIRTEDDRYVTNLVKYNAAVQAGRTVMANEAIAALVAANRAPPAEMASLLAAQGKAARLVDRKRAEAIFTQAAQMNPGDGDILAMLAGSQAENGKPAQAVETMARAIAAKKAAGQPAPEAWYARAVAIANDGKLVEQTSDAAQALVSAYPSADNWHDAVTLSRMLVADPGTRLDLHRLARATGALKGESEYLDYAAAATAAGFAGEAKAVLAEGVQRNMLGSAAAPAKGKGKGKDKGKAPAGVAKSALAGLAKTARASSTGKAAMSAADAALSYEDYVLAAELYRLALTKGGVDAAAANTRLGIALARSGDKSGAAQALAQVTGPRAAAAKLWSAWVGQPGSLAQASAPAVSP
jgi:hypothetical protein